VCTLFTPSVPVVVLMPCGRPLAALGFRFFLSNYGLRCPQGLCSSLFALDARVCTRSLRRRLYNSCTPSASIALEDVKGYCCRCCKSANPMPSHTSNVDGCEDPLALNDGFISRETSTLSILMHLTPPLLASRPPSELATSSGVLVPLMQSLVADNLYEHEPHCLDGYQLRAASLLACSTSK
jgi:hypothetical protein